MHSSGIDLRQGQEAYVECKQTSCFETPQLPFKKVVIVRAVAKGNRFSGTNPIFVRRKKERMQPHRPWQPCPVILNFWIHPEIQAVVAVGIAGVFALLTTLAKNRSCTGPPRGSNCKFAEFWNARANAGISRSTQILYFLVFVTRPDFCRLF